MGIILAATEKKAKLKAKSDELCLREDRDKLLKIPNKVAKFVMNHETHHEELSHWEFPGHQIEDVLCLWDDPQIQANEKARELINEFLQSNIPIEDLPRYGGELFKSKDGKIPRPWQENAIRVDPNKKALLLSFGVRLGKTMTALIRAKMVRAKSMLIIVPKKLISDWKTAIRNCYDEPVLEYKGTKKQREKLKEDIKDANIVITNYEMVKELTDYEFDFFIIDEIHIVSGSQSALYKSLDKVMRDNPDAHRIGLSATPKRMTLDNLFSVCHLLDPVWTGRKSNFMSKFRKTTLTKKIRKTNKAGQQYELEIPVKTKVKNHDQLRDKLKCLTIRETHEGKINFEDLADIVHVDMTTKQAKLYHEILHQVREELKLNPRNPLTKTLRLLQATEGTYTLVEDMFESGKIDFVLDDIKNRPDEKACIWFRFLPGTKYICSKLGSKAVLYTGEVSEPLKDYAKWAFNGVTNKEDEKRFFQIKEKYNLTLNPGEAQYIVGTYGPRSGMGVDLYLSDLNYILSYDHTPISLAQVRGRILNIDKENDCETKLLVSTNTIEPRIVQRILRSLEEGHDIFDGKDSQESKLMRDLELMLWDD